MSNFRICVNRELLYSNSNGPIKIFVRKFVIPHRIGWKLTPKRAYFEAIKTEFMDLMDKSILGVIQRIFYSDSAEEEPGLRVPADMVTLSMFMT